MGQMLVSELERCAVLPEISGPGWIFGGGPVSDNPVSQDLANQGKKLFAALALMVSLPNV